MGMIASFCYNDNVEYGFLGKVSPGTLEYASLGVFNTAEEARERVKQAFARWKEDDCRALCEDSVRHLQGPERAAEMRRLVQSPVSIRNQEEKGLLNVTAHIKGLDAGGSSNWWRWMPLPAGADLPAAARSFYRDIGGSQATDAPVPVPHVSH